MSTRLPPRYLPTLTEVVDPQSMAAAVLTAVPSPPPAAAEPLPGLEPSPMATATSPAIASEPAPAPVPAPVAPVHAGLPATAVPDRHALAQQLIHLVRPQLEAELRAIAQELFEAQFSALLPSMHLHIEEAVREALEQALPEANDDTHL